MNGLDQQSAATAEHDAAPAEEIRLPPVLRACQRLAGPVLTPRFVDALHLARCDAEVGQRHHLLAAGVTGQMEAVGQLDQM